MIVAQRTADAVTIQVKNIDVKLPLSLHQDIDSLSLSYGKASKSVPITQFIAADGAPLLAGQTSPLVRVPIPAQVKEPVTVHFEHADKKNHFTIQVNALREGAKTGTGQKSRAGQNNSRLLHDHAVRSFPRPAHRAGVRSIRALAPAAG